MIGIGLILHDHDFFLQSMVNPDPKSRPNASRLVTMIALRTNGANSKSRSQLHKELRDARTKLKLLEQELQSEKASSHQKASLEFPTPPKDKETSSPASISSTTPPPPKSPADIPIHARTTELYSCHTRSRDSLNMISSSNTSATITGKLCMENLRAFFRVHR